MHRIVSAVKWNNSFKLQLKDTIWKKQCHPYWHKGFKAVGLVSSTLFTAPPLNLDNDLNFSLEL